MFQFKFEHCMTEGLTIDDVREEIRKDVLNIAPFQNVGNEERQVTVRWLSAFSKIHNIIGDVYHTAVFYFDRYTQRSSYPCLTLIGPAALILANVHTGYNQQINWHPEEICPRVNFSESLHDVENTLQLQPGLTSSGVMTAADCLFYYTLFAKRDASLAFTVSEATHALRVGCNALSAATDDILFTVNTPAELAAGVIAILINEDYAKDVSGLDSWDIVVAVDFVRSYVQKAQCDFLALVAEPST